MPTLLLTKHMMLGFLASTQPTEAEIPQADKQQDTQQNIGAILKRMAEEIASLRNRVNQLEQKFEKSETPKTSNDADFEQVLKILESSDNGNLSI